MDAELREALVFALVPLSKESAHEILAAFDRGSYARAALRRIASTEAFTGAMDLNHPTLVKTEAVIAELQARMRYAAEQLAAVEAAR